MAKPSPEIYLYCVKSTGKKYDEIFQQENDFAVLKAETKKLQSEFSVLEEQLNGVQKKMNGILNVLQNGDEK